MQKKLKVKKKNSAQCCKCKMTFERIHLVSVQKQLSGTTERKGKINLTEKKIIGDFE